MRFPDVDRSGDVALRVDELAKSFEHPLFEDVTLQIERGERWGILGPNGCGKTTLLRCLVGQLTPDAGHIQIGHRVQLGYFDQQLQGVDGLLSAADAVRPPRDHLDDQQRRDLLARFGITGDQALQTVDSLSGGQRTRVALAKLAASQANFLILDEPTNHLDLWSRHALEQALLDFHGSVLVVSHDRYFINRVCDHLLIMDETQPTVIEGNYETYLQMKSLARQAAPATPQVSPTQNLAPNNSGPIKRKRKFPYRKVPDIEAEIRQHETAIDDLHADLTKPEVLRDKSRVVAANSRLEQLHEQLKKLYEHWEEACELN